MTTPAAEPLPGDEMPFGMIVNAMTRATCQDAGATRALVATVVAVGPRDRLTHAAETLQKMGDAGTVRGIVISEGEDPAPPARVAGNTVSIHGLKAPYVNNAVAALRLSSLPTLVWWRGGRPETLDGLADLADRIVLDEEDPEPTWRGAVTLFEDSAFSDLRWARLTQWRALMAHFFDIPEVRAASPDFTRLQIAGPDRMSARLFAAWLTTSIKFKAELAVELEAGAQCECSISEIRLGDGDQDLTIRLAPGSCLETAVSVPGHRSASRVVALGDQSPAGLLNEELRIRARDIAFERAVRALVSTPTG